MPRRVLYVSHVHRLGGAERSLLDLLDGLDPARYAAHVALPGDGDLADGLTARGIPWDACPGLGRLYRSALRAPAGLSGLVRGNRALRALARSLQPDQIGQLRTVAALIDPNGLETRLDPTDIDVGKPEIAKLLHRAARMECGSR